MSNVDIPKSISKTPQKRTSTVALHWFLYNSATKSVTGKASEQGDYVFCPVSRRWRRIPAVDCPERGSSPSGRLCRRTPAAAAVEGARPPLLSPEGLQGVCGADTPRSQGAPLHRPAPAAGRAPLQKLLRDPRAWVASGARPRRPAGEEPPPSRFVPRRRSGAERGRRRGRLRLKLAERRRGTGRPFPPRRNAHTHPPSLRRRLGERPPAESPGAAEPSLATPRRRREGVGAWRAAASRGRVRAGRVGKSLRGRGYLRAGGGAANAGGGGAGLRGPAAAFGSRPRAERGPGHGPGSQLRATASSRKEAASLS
ncbi:unnamed protein product [Coccothraustes coccothraustes]